MKYIFCGQAKEKLLSYGSLKKDDEFFHLPLTQRKKVPIRLPFREHYNFVVIASQSVIEYFPEGKEIKTGQWVAVGPQTAKMLQDKWGITEARIPDEYNALSTAEFILNQSQEGSVLWLGAKEGVVSGIQKLSQAGLDVEVSTPYESYPVPVKELSHVWEERNLSYDDFIHQEAVWMFTSPLTAHSYLNQKLNRKLHLLSCLGPTTASVFLQKSLILYYVSDKSTLYDLARGLKMYE